MVQVLGQIAGEMVVYYCCMGQNTSIVSQQVKKWDDVDVLSLNHTYRLKDGWMW